MKPCSHCGKIDRLSRIILQSVDTKERRWDSGPICSACAAGVIMNVKKQGVNQAKPDLPFLSSN